MSRPRKTMLPKWMDAYLPPCGPCLLCGGADKRHRIVDAIRGSVRAGDSIAIAARAYEVPQAFVRKLTTRRDWRGATPPA